MKYAFVCSLLIVMFSCHSSKELNASQTVLSGTKWEIKTLQGQQISIDSQEKFTILFKDESTFSAYIGCNVINGNYLISDGLKIRFEKVFSTMKMCPEMNYEDNFKSLLETINNFSISEQKLTLNRAKMAPLVTLERLK